ncbi:sortase [Bacillus sp. DX1.1]|uniref:sortase n=1 Tax=unclassified Bacillus (in: firmicutes) TaxID=185979 RepID=UPI002570F0FF|nr:MULTISPECIES: sortase [unclassified Bacillus (in: firmicutes)]MDM5157365.1 sortase [Bacillus sp. DX1.1]WJE81590.1 sortase [Bacillus sp. DX3.1]
MEKRKKVRKRKSKWRWVIIGIPVSTILIGLGIVAFFGWELTKQTALLAHTVVTPYKPAEPEKEFKQLWSKRPDPGDKIGELKFPSLDYDVPVVQGTQPKELKSGVGHFAGSLLPGQGGNVVLNGHRNTSFHKLEGVKKGDSIKFSTPYGEFVYEITDLKITGANDNTIIVPTDYETLTLTTCYPFEYIGDAPD